MNIDQSASKKWSPKYLYAHSTLGQRTIMSELRMLAIDFARDKTTSLDRKGYCCLHNITEADFYQNDEHAYALAKQSDLHFFGYCNQRGFQITMTMFKQAVKSL